MSEELQKLYRRALQMMVIQVIMIGLIVLFFGLVVPPNPAMVAAYGKPDSRRILMMIRYVFLALALVDFAAVPLIRRLILSQKPVQPPTPSAFGPVSNGIWKLFIVGMAVSGMPAIFGAVFFTMTRNQTDLVIFSGLSALLMAMGFPRTVQWEEWERVLSEKARL